MLKEKMKGRQLLALIVALFMVFSLAPQSAFADGGSEDDVEWGSLTNNTDNNAVTDRKTPVSAESTTLKWGIKHGAGWSVAVSPPVSVNGHLYVTAGTELRKLDKATGETIDSVAIGGSAAYAMQPPTYGEGKLFVQIGTGKIVAFDVKTLEKLWVSEAISSNQTISPINYKNGYVYTGTWRNETADGSYFCLSASATEDVYDVDGVATKKATWNLTPSVGVTTSGGVTSIAGISTPAGFYWMGAYVGDNCVVFGSDDGSAASTQTDTAVLYSMHPTSGEVIDTLKGIKGDIRTNMTQSGGYLYFATKGKLMYKVKLNSDGTFGASSYIDTGGAMTASPVVHNGRIYLGVSGASQFDPDSNHVYAVIKDEATLTQDSLIYTVSIPGYPQATSVLSTQDEENTGDVYIYFTYNANPGGIYCLKDNPKSGEKGEVINLFTPPSAMQQYCISTIAAGKDGTLYYKNDSGYLMAVGTNDAVIDDIVVTPDVGEAKWDSEFKSSQIDYEVKVSSKATSADVELKLPEGVTAKINDEEYTGKYTCHMTEGPQELTVVTSKNDDEMTYNLKISCESTDSTLADLEVNNSNTYGSNPVTLQNEFSPTAQNHKTTILDDKSITFVNVWPSTSNEDATLKVYPVANVSNSGSNLNEDGSIAPIYNNQGRYRYPVYFTKGETYSKVRVEVTSEDRSSTTEYYLTVYRTTDSSGSRIDISKDNATIYSKGLNNSIQLTAEARNYSGSIHWESDDSSIAKVSSKGLVEGVKPGTTKIRADIGTESAECVITVKAPTVKLSASSATIYKASVKNSTKLTATVNGVAKQKVKWSVTSGSKYASVDSNGTVKAKATGVATITAEANGVKTICKVTVKAPKFELTASKKTIKKGKSYTIKVRTNEPKGKVTFKSQNKKVATVTSKGVVRGKKKGTTYITAKCNGITKKIKITVK